MNAEQWKGIEDQSTNCYMTKSKKYNIGAILALKVEWEKFVLFSGWLNIRKMNKEDVEQWKIWKDQVYPDRQRNIHAQNFDNIPNEGGENLKRQQKMKTIKMYNFQLVCQTLLYLSRANKCVST